MIRIVLLFNVLLWVSSCASSPKVDPNSPVYQFHASILTQADEAWRQGDLQRLSELLKGSRAGVTADQATRYQLLEGMLQAKLLLSKGLAFHGFMARCAQESAVLKIKGLTAFHLDAPYELELMLRSGKGQSGAFGVGKAASLLVVEGSFVDTLSDGGQVRRTFPLTLRVPGRKKIDPKGWRMPIPGPGFPSNRVLIRKVQLRGQLFCQALEWNGVAVPLTKIPLEPLTIFLLPKGTEAIQKDPLGVLKTALKTPLKKGPHLLVATFLCGLEPQTRKAAKKILASSLAEENLAAESLLRRAFRLLSWASEKKGPESWERLWKAPKSLGSEKREGHGIPSSRKTN